MKTARRDLIVVLLFWSRFQFASLACPKKCDCRNTANGFLVSCTGKGLKTPINPDELPSDTSELDMSRNDIEHLGSKAFRGKTLSKLKKLDLSQNRLSLLEEDVFRGLKSLRNLDLSRNNLLMLNKTQFYGCKNLRTINLANNKIMVLPDGLFKSLGNLKTINLQLNPLICDCNLKWLVKWREKFQLRGSNKRLPVQGRCEHPLLLKDKKISGLDRREMTCDKLDLPVMEFSPQGHQVAFKGDRQLFQCRYSWIPESSIAWYKDSKLLTVDPDMRRDIANNLDTNVAVATSVLKIESVTTTDSGSYTCNVTYKGGYVHVRKSRLSVISHNSKFCKAETTETDKGTFHWHRTAAGGFALLPCPMGVMGRLYDSSSGEEMTAKRGCSVDGKWMAISAEACAYTNEITQTLHSLKEETVDEYTAYEVSKQLLNISRRAKEFGDSADVIFAADVVSKLNQAIGSDEELNTNLVHSISNLAEVDDSLLQEAQRKAKSCSSMIIALDLFHTRFPMTSEAEVSVVSKNIAVQVVRISLKDMSAGKTCIVTKETESAKLKDVECVPWTNNTSFENDADFEASIHLPPTLTQKIPIIQPQSFPELLKFQFIVYFNSKLFPRLLNGSEEEKNLQVTSSVVSAQLGGIQLTNLSDPLVIKFRNHQDGEQAAPVYWDIEAGGGLGKWMKNSDCAISSQGNNTVTRCHQLSNKDFFAVMMFVKQNEGLPSVAFPRGPFSLEPIVFVGAGICCLLILVTLVTYIVFRELRFNRDDAAMLMNLCLALLVMVVVFVVGIDYVTNTLVCRAVGVLLHYFLLCSLLWLGCGGICLLRLIRTAIQPEDFNPVLRYYMISWGIPLIICGITIAGNPDNYNVKEYCWLRPYPFFGAMAGPACLITIIDLVIFIRLHNVIRRTYNGETKELSEAAESVAEENALVVEQDHSSKQDVSDEAGQKTALPDKDDIVVYLRGSSCILFVIILTVLLGLLSIHFQKSRVVYVSLSCMLAMTVVFLGLVIFIFHCYKKEKVRLFWRNCLNCKCLLKDRYEVAEENATVENCEEPSSSRAVGDEVNEETGKFAVDEIHGAKHPLLHGNVDSQSNVSLPSSAAITIERLASAVEKEKETLAEKAPSVSDKQSSASAPLPCKYEARGKLRQHPPGFRHSFTEPSELPRAVVELQRAPIAPPEATASSVDSSIQLPTDTESNAAASEGRLPVRDTVDLLNASRNTNTSCSASEASGPTDVVPALKRVPMCGVSPQGSDRVPALPIKKIRNSSTLPGARDYLAVHRPQTVPVGFAHHSVAEATTNSLPRQIPRDHVVVREQYHIPYEPRAVSEKPRDHYQILPLPSDRTRDHYLLQPGYYPGNGHDLYQDPRCQAAAQPLEQQNTGLEARDQGLVSRDQGLVSRESSPRPPDQHQIPRDEGPISRPHDQYQMARDQSPFPRPHEHYQLPRDQSPSPRAHEQYQVPRDHGLGQRVRDHYQTPRDLHTVRDPSHGQRSHDQYPSFRGHEQNQPTREQSLYPRPHDLIAVADNPRDDHVTSVDPSQSSRDQNTRKENAACAAQDPAERAHDQYAGEGPLPVDKPGVRPNSAPRGSRDKANVIHVPRRRSRNPYQIARDIHLGLERSRDAQSRQVTQTPAEPKSPARETAPTQGETTRERETVRTPDEAPPRERTPRSSMSSWKEERPKPGPKDWVNEPPKSAVFVPVPHLKRTAPTPQTRTETSV